MATNNYAKPRQKQYGDNEYWNGPQYEQDVARYQSQRAQSEWEPRTVIDERMAAGRGIPSQNADNWYGYVRRGQDPMVVPIDDMADRTRENGWVHPDLTERNFFGRALEDERYGPWEYYPERDRRISQSKLQQMYNRMMEAMPWR